jgi:hypothetical protein
MRAHPNFSKQLQPVCNSFDCGCVLRENLPHLYPKHRIVFRGQPLPEGNGQNLGSLKSHGHSNSIVRQKAGRIFESTGGLTL